MRWRLSGALAFLLGLSMLGGCGVSATHSSPTPPSRPTVVAGPFHTSVQTFDGDFTLAIDINPNRSGPNQFRALVMDNHAHKLATNIVITLYTTMQDMAMGTDSVVLHAEGSGQFGATSNVLSMGGHWALGITIQTLDHVIHKAGVSFVTSV